MTKPPRPTGTSSLDTLLRYFYDTLERFNPRRGPNVLGSVTTRGTFESIPSQGGGPSVPATGGMNFRGEYDTNTQYQTNDVVVIRGGNTAGTYIATNDTLGLDPSLGNGWVSLAPGDIVGKWV